MKNHAYVAELVILNPPSRSQAYDVRGDREGFAPWREVAVEVVRDQCHVLSVQPFAVMVDLRNPR